MDESDLSKQLHIYADTIAAFAILQSVAFCYAVEKGDSMTCTALHHLPLVCWLNAGATIFYVIGTLLCYRGENRLTPLDASPDSIRYVKERLRVVRIAMIIGAGTFAIATMFIVRSQYTTLDCAKVTPFLGSQK